MKETLIEKIKDGFSLDKRSLSLYRVLISIYLLVDLITRFRNFKEFYTDEGSYPRSSAIQIDRYSLHQLSGSVEFGLLMFLIQALIYISMLIGYKTRISTILSFIFLCSIQNRNHFLIDGSDDYSRILLFWTIFLPLNKYFSIDSIIKEEKQQQETRKLKLKYKLTGDLISTTTPTVSSTKKALSGSTIAFLLQFIFIYIFTALFKTADTWHKEYSAVYYALNLIQFRHGLAEFLLQFPRFLIFLTRGTLVFEYIGPLLLVSPFYNTQCRLISIFGFIAMHIGFGVCLNLYLFVFIPMVVCMAFLPSDFWDFLENNWISKKDLITIHYNSNSSKSLQLFIKGFSRFFLFNQNYKIKLSNNTSKNNNDNGEMDINQDNRENLFYVDSISIYNNGQIYDEDKSIKFLFQRSIFTFLISKLIPDIFYKLIYSLIINFNNNGNNEDYHKIEKKSKNSNNHSGGNSSSKLKEKSKYRKPLNNLFFILLTTYMFYYNVCIYTTMKDSGLNENIWTPVFQPFVKFIKIDQYWAMFAPSPPDYSSWIVSDAKFSFVKQLDLFTLEETQFKTIPPYYFNIGQRKRNFYLAVGYLENLRLEFGRYQCRQFNIHSIAPEFGRLESFKIYSVYQETPLPPVPSNNYQTLPPTGTKLQLIWEHVC